MNGDFTLNSSTEIKLTDTNIAKFIDDAKRLGIIDEDLKITNLYFYTAMYIKDTHAKCEKCGVGERVDIDDKLCHSCFHEGEGEGECYCELWSCYYCDTLNEGGCDIENVDPPPVKINGKWVCFQCADK